MGHGGLILLAAPISTLLIPAKTAIGGAPGLGVLIHLITGISPGTIIFSINIFCFLLAGKVLGWRAGFKTLYAALFLGFFVEGLYRLLPHYQIANFWISWLTQTIASLLMGLGLWISVRAGYAPAGTTALAAVLEKKWGWPLIYSLWVMDLGISLGCFYAISLKSGVQTFYGASIMYLTMTQLGRYSKARL